VQEIRTLIGLDSQLPPLNRWLALSCGLNMTRPGLLSHAVASSWSRLSRSRARDQSASVAVTRGVEPATLARACRSSLGDHSAACESRSHDHVFHRVARRGPSPKDPRPGSAVTAERRPTWRMTRVRYGSGGSWPEELGGRLVQGIEDERQLHPRDTEPSPFLAWGIAHGEEVHPCGAAPRCWASAKRSRGCERWNR